jgi:hypothetical protein
VARRRRAHPPNRRATPFDNAVQHGATIELPLRSGQFVRHGDVVFRHSIDPTEANDDELIEAGRATPSVATARQSAGRPHRRCASRPSNEIKERRQRLTQ